MEGQQGILINSFSVIAYANGTQFNDNHPLKAERKALMTGQKFCLDSRIQNIIIEGTDLSISGDKMVPRK